MVVPREPRLYRDETTGLTYAWVLVLAEETGVDGLVFALGGLTHLASGQRLARFPDKASAERAARTIAKFADWGPQEHPVAQDARPAIEAAIEAAGGVRGEEAPGRGGA